jgi:hypothetical protein
MEYGTGTILKREDKTVFREPQKRGLLPTPSCKPVGPQNQPHPKQTIEKLFGNIERDLAYLKSMFRGLH